MISKRLAAGSFFGTAFVVVLLVPAIALAQETAAAAAHVASAPGASRWARRSRWALGARQPAGRRPGSVPPGQGTLAERPEERVFVLTLTALPEIIVLLGFVMAILING